MSLVAQGLREARAYLNRIHNRLPLVQQEAIGGPEALQFLELQARADVINVVYAAYNPTEYVRRDVIAKSVRAAVVQQEPFQVAIFIPLNSETEAIAGGAAGQMTYARFMLPGWSADSFLNGRAAESLPRDFLGQWEKTFGEEVPRKVLQAIDRELAK